jgi:peptidoglycan hydrolase-like protein with peptidoglycan-binding domain
MPNNNSPMKVKEETLGNAFNYISSFYKSFSGTDTLVFIMMPGRGPVVLGSITTLSYSLYRTKQPVINLGRTNINGATRGARIFAGSMIFTMINQHWLKELQDTEELSWLKEYSQLKADELPLFDLMVVSANEYGSYVSMFLYGVDITDEGQVVSVNDLFTENTCSFIARDIETFTAGKRNETYTAVSLKNRYLVKDIENKGWDFIKEDFLFAVQNDAKNVWDYSKTKFDMDYGPGVKQPNPVLEEPPVIERTYILRQQNMQEAAERLQILKGFTENLEYREFNPIVSDSVGNVQLALKELNIIDFVSNLYDLATYKGVKEYQSTHGFEVNGIVDAKLYTALMTDANMLDGRVVGNVINKSGTMVYLYPDDLNASIVAILNYGDNIVITDRIQNEMGDYFYKIEQGYIKEADIYSYYYSPNDKEFPTIKLFETGYQVLVLQQLLSTKYQFNYIPGTYDLDTQAIISQIQTENNINCTIGIVNDDTWRVVESITGNLTTNITTNNVTVISQNAQQSYHVTSNSLDTEFMQGFDVTIISPMATTIKAVCVGYYPNGKNEMMTKGYILNPNESIQIPFETFQDMFTYSIEHKSIPEKIEYIIYPSNGNAFKWIIHYSI